MDGLIWRISTFQTTTWMQLTKGGINSIGLHGENIWGGFGCLGRIQIDDESS